MNNIDLNKILSKLRSESNADWIGLREMKETTTYRVIRDLKPASNNTSIDHGIMIEVLVNGQFGYYGTHDISYEAIKNATEKLIRKHCDWIIANNVSDPSIGFNSNENEISIIYKNKNIDKIKKNSKSFIAYEISKRIIANFY